MDNHGDVLFQIFGRVAADGLSPMPLQKLDYLGVIKVMKCCQFEALGHSNKLLNNVGYGDVCGRHKLMDRIREIIELSLHYPILFELLDVKPHCGVLLLCIKNAFIAHAVAQGSYTYSFLINDPDIIPKLAGSSGSIFCNAVKNDVKDALAIIFIDDINSIAHEHEKSKQQLPSLVDGLKQLV